MYIYLIPDTYFLKVSFPAIFPYKNPYPESSTGQAVAPSPMKPNFTMAAPSNCITQPCFIHC